MNLIYPVRVDFVPEELMYLSCLSYLPAPVIDPLTPLTHPHLHASLLLGGSWVVLSAVISTANILGEN